MVLLGRVAAPVRIVFTVPLVHSRQVEDSGQKVAGPARRVDRAQAGHLLTRPIGPMRLDDRCQPELLDRGLQGHIKDELFDELRGPRQRVGLARGLAQILVQVTEEAGVPRVAGEVVADLPVGAPPPEREQRGRRLEGRCQLPQRVVPPVKSS